MLFDGKTSATGDGSTPISAITRSFGNQGLKEMVFESKAFKFTSTSCKTDH